MPVPVTAGARTLVVRCDDWPIVAAGVALDTPAATIHGSRVVATSPAARAAGVVPLQRRREAQSVCPELLLLEHDPARDARAFMAVTAALDAITPRVEITIPGVVAFPTRGPSRFFGGDDALAARVRAVVDDALHGAAGALARSRCRVGLADGFFAADLAARTGAVAGEPLVVAQGASATFLAGLPLHTLDRPDLVGLLRRLGLRTLGDLAALPERDMLGRFGTEGRIAWCQAAGLEERPLAPGPPAVDLTVSVELDPPALTTAPAAFLARGLAEELHGRLWARGSACTRVIIGAETEHGERLERVWRAEGALTAAAMVDRLRWQLDGWLQGSTHHRPTAGIARLWFSPDEVVPARGRQLGFWGNDTAAADRAGRAVARVQGLLGVGSVAVPEWRGSRDPATQVMPVAAETVDLTEARPDAQRSRARALGPWPGRLPAPSPAWVHATAVVAEVVDSAGQAVQVSGRGMLSAPPAQLSVAGGAWTEVVEWAGPWPLEERWWDTTRHRRRARLQVVTADGQARLVVLEAGAWHLAATYD